MVRSKKKKPAIRFEIGWSGLFAVGVVCFCIFLWMFLLGVWTGQALLEPGDNQRDGLKEFAAQFWQESKPAETQSQKKGKTKEKVETEVSQSSPLSQEKSVFSLQVAAFRERAKARRVVLQWRARDYEAFYLAPEEPNGTFYRVFVGSYADISEAKKNVAALADPQKNKYFIALIPAQEKRFP